MASKGTVTNLAVKIQTNTARTVFAYWSWDEAHTDHYHVIWSYSTGQYSSARKSVVYFIDEDSTTKNKTSVYNAPSNATQVQFRVLPVAADKGDEKKTPYWTATWSKRYYYTFSKTIGRKTPDNTNKVTGLTLTKEHDTDRTIRINWVWKDGTTGNAQTDYFKVDVDYQTADKTWYHADDAQSEHQYYTYNAPNNAVTVRCRVQPIAKMYIDGDYETPWWNAKWTAFETYTFEKTDAEKEREKTDRLQKKPTDIRFGIQNGTERSVYVAWKWDESNTDHYEVSWEYHTGNGLWFAGSSDTSVTKKNALYSAPDNAIKIRCRIRAISKTRSNNVKYWTANWSEWNEYEIPKAPPDTGGSDKEPYSPAMVDLVPDKIKFRIANETERDVLVTWNWSKSNTAKFAYQWDYTEGHTQTNPKTKKPGYIWISGSSGETVDASSSHRNAVYSAPSNAIAVRFRVKAISTNYDGSDVARWIADYCAWQGFSIPQPSQPSAPKIDNLSSTPFSLSLKKQAGTDRSIYATWGWNVKNTDHYEFEFEYKAGTVWFEGSTGSTNGNTKQSALYSVPDNAVKARFRVQPISKSRTFSGDNKEYVYWLAKYSNWVYWNCPAPTSATKTTTVRNVEIDYQEGSDNIVFAKWDWDGTLKGVYESDGKTLRDLTKEYKVTWRFKTDNNGVWFDGSEETVTRKLSTYSVPSNAKKVYVKIRPISKTRKVNGKEAAYWTAKTCTAVSFATRQEEESKEPAEPATPTVTMNGLKLRAELSTYDTNTKIVQFSLIQIPATGSPKGYKTLRAEVKYDAAAVEFTVAAGSFYKVHARGLRPTKSSALKTLLSDVTSKKDVEFGPWSQYSEAVGTVPAAPKSIKSHKILSADSLRIDWAASATATGYEIEYTTNKDYFDSSDQTTTQTQESTTTHREITGLEAGKYFFRVRAKNDVGDSGWTPIYSATVGTAPSAPTTWSETTTALLTESVNLYWMHNSEDGSSQTKAEVEITVGSDAAKKFSPTKLSTDETSSYYTCRPVKYTNDDILDSGGDTLLDSKGNVIYSEAQSNFPEGTVVKWRVRTQGALVGSWGPWSAQRSVIFYAPPGMILRLDDSYDDVIDRRVQSVRSYPIHVRASVEPSTQKAIGYDVSIIAGESYSTTDEDGTERFIGEGETIYSKYISSTKGSENEFVHDIKAGDIALEDGVSYIITVTAAMDSGLTAEDNYMFKVIWDDIELGPNAEIQFDEDTYCAYIHPYCVDGSGERVDNVKLSVYRREYDGSFTLIEDDIDNGDATNVTDPHPALDYARYRIVARSEETGQIGYYDPPGLPVGITSIIIQWDEKWSNLNLDNDDLMETNTWTEEPVWTGSLVKFPYNIGISADYSMDVSLVEYIGRKHPVSYYGTQLGESASWTAEIPRNDAETLYQLRRLAIYPGNCYVREPSGSGYWAQVTPSFSKSYDNMVIPVTLKVTRVEGGA